MGMHLVHRMVVRAEGGDVPAASPPRPEVMLANASRCSAPLCFLLLLLLAASRMGFIRSSRTITTTGGPSTGPDRLR